jgi:glucose-6-phosphate 1-dehydrogenase
METLTRPTIVVIVGISGDLSKRKLLPAIRAIHKAGILPEQFKIIGTTRQALDITDVLPDGDIEFLRDHLELLQLNLAEASEYHLLIEKLVDVEEAFGAAAQRLFYLSVPPQVSQPIITNLGNSGLATPDTKLLLEKPFGTNHESAEELISHIMQHFNESQIYRIDHYLAKEMAQNLLTFRGSNSLFKQTWNKAFIDEIHIMAHEAIDIEDRAGFYEQTGALRDLVQSHLLQLAALTLMDMNIVRESVPKARLQALKELLPPDDISTMVIRGQYQGYPEQVDNPGSSTETYVSLTLHSKDPAWEGVPIKITTGKAMNEKRTEIRIRYHQADCPDANELILHVQPDEGIEIKLWVKEPGHGGKTQQLPLDFVYDQYFHDLPEAYERVFADAFAGDHSLFTTSDEVLESWRILDPIQHAWSMRSSDLLIYPRGASIEAITELAGEPQ